MKDSTKFLIMISILLLIGINCRAEKPIIKVKQNVGNGLYEASDSIDILQNMSDEKDKEIGVLKSKVDSLNAVAISFKDMLLKAGGIETHWYDGILTPSAGEVVNTILYWAGWIIGFPVGLCILFFALAGIRLLVGLAH